MKRISIYIAFLLSVLFGWFSPPMIARAQALPPLTLRSLEVDIWPEYDRPTVLVIYHLTLPSEVALPVELRIRIPSIAGEPHALAVREADGSLITISYTRNVLGEWSEIVFTTTSPEIQLEYYDPTLKKDGSQRTFSYQWAGDYAVDSLTIQIQQPIGAAEMKITPNTTNVIVGKDGLTYYVTQVDSLSVGQSFEVSVQYRKPNDSLTAESLKVQPSAPMGSATSTTPVASNPLPWLLGSLGAFLIIGAVAWWFWQARTISPRPKANRPRRRRLVIEPQEVIPEGAVYCHHCGKRALPGDRFCRACGTKLRP
ncbi:MAG: zinc ribbon domain-containing protein [Anaerolineales bacterium]|nr:zinc ribbon domain-containing protein [Anaerolineales bacterium]